MKNIAGKVYRRLIGGRMEEKRYQKWIAAHMRALLEGEKDWEAFEKKPLYSIVVPLYRTPEPFLQELVGSVRAQTYPKWELILSDGSGQDSPLEDCLRVLGQDDRIRILENREQLDISENTNRALAIAKGDYIVFADHDDVLPPCALYECTRAVCEQGEPDLIYSDEDKVTMDGKTYFQPHFKPDFNLTLLRSMNYFCHLVVVKRSLQQEVGLLQAAYNGAQDYDFVLRCAERAEKICHIPKILYHWRSHAGSIAGSGSSKEYAFEAGRKAVEAHLARCGVRAQVQKGGLFGICHAVYEIQGEPLVSVILQEGAKAPQILKRGGWKRYEVLTEKEIRKAGGEYCLFLDSSFEKASQGWLREMLAQASAAGVGIAGAHLYRADGKQESAGVIVGGEELLYDVSQGDPKDAVGYFGRNTCAQEYSAVNGMCMLISRECLEAAGGLDGSFESPLRYADLCLRAGKAGFRVVYAPAARLLSSGSAGRKPGREEKERFREKWAGFLEEGDPYYNCNQGIQKKLFRLKRDAI